jgi:hypothetical protein
MKRAAWLLVPLLWSACGASPLPEPSIVSVVPERVAANAPASLSVRVSGVLPFRVNYQEGSVEEVPQGLKLWLAGKEVDIAFTETDGTLIVPVPEALPLGAYDAQLVLEDGREALRERAFSVVPEPQFVEGGAPAEDIRDAVTGLQIDPIEEQVRNRPFQITIRALGPKAELFQGQLTVRSNKGQATSVTPGVFSGGVRVEELSLSQPNPGVYLLVEDMQGHQALSNSFRVRPN